MKDPFIDPYARGSLEVGSWSEQCCTSLCLLGSVDCGEKEEREQYAGKTGLSSALLSQQLPVLLWCINIFKLGSLFWSLPLPQKIGPCTTFLNHCPDCLHEKRQFLRLRYEKSNKKWQKNLFHFHKVSHFIVIYGMKFDRNPSNGLKSLKLLKILISLVKVFKSWPDFGKFPLEKHWF